MSDPEKLICTICGSDRVIKGPFYNPNDIYCMQCGHREEGPEEIHYAQTELEIKTERAEKVQQDTANVLEQFKDVDMTDPEQAEAYLKALREQAAQVNKNKPEKKSRSPKGKKSAEPAPELETETSLDNDLIMMGIHVYMRRGSNWQQTINDAKGEKEYRNDNILVYAHEHPFGEACDGKNCRQV